MRGVGAETRLARQHPAQSFDIAVKGHDQQARLRPRQQLRQRRQQLRFTPHHQGGELTHWAQHPTQQPRGQHQREQHQQPLRNPRGKKQLPGEIAPRLQRFANVNLRHSVNAVLVDRLQQARHADRLAAILGVIKPGQRRVERGAGGRGRHGR